MRITGLSYKDQFADIVTQVEGPVAGAWALLKEPRLHLLSTHPIGLKTAGGDVSGTLTFQFPLENTLTMDDVAIHADMHVKRVRILDIAYGHDLDDAAFDLDVTKDGLTPEGARRAGGDTADDDRQHGFLHRPGGPGGAKDRRHRPAG